MGVKIIYRNRIRLEAVQNVWKSPWTVHPNYWRSEELKVRERKKQKV